MHHSHDESSEPGHGHAVHDGQGGLPPLGGEAPHQAGPGGPGGGVNQELVSFDISSMIVQDSPSLLLIVHLTIA